MVFSLWERKYVIARRSAHPPGKDIDVLVTQGAVAVKSKNEQLKSDLVKAGLPVVNIE